jgi:DNA-binding XRE family transcriptional regulator
MPRKVKPRATMRDYRQIDNPALIAHLETMPLRDRMVTLRGVHNLSQTTLGKKLNMSRAAVAGWETEPVGKAHSYAPSKRARMALAHLFHIPAHLFTQNLPVDLDDYRRLLAEEEGVTTDIPVQTDQREEAIDTESVPEVQVQAVEPEVEVVTDPLPRDRPNTVGEMVDGVRRIL